MSKTGKIILVSLFIIHLWIMTGLYIDIIPFVSAAFFQCPWWESYLHRTYIEIIILSLLSLSFIYTGFYFIKRKTKRHILLSASLFISGLYLFFLSGQTIYVSQSASISECFYFIPFNERPLGNSGVAINDNFLYTKIKTESCEFIFLNGIGPFAKFNYDYLHSYKLVQATTTNDK